MVHITIQSDKHVPKSAFEEYENQIDEGEEIHVYRLWRDKKDHRLIFEWIARYDHRGWTCFGDEYK